MRVTPLDTLPVAGTGAHFRLIATAVAGLCAAAVALAILFLPSGHPGLAYSWSQPAGQIVTSPTIPAHLQYTWHAVEATP